MSSSEAGWLSLYYGYLDESGDVTPFSGSRYFIIAALLTKNPRPIELHVKRARASLGRKSRPDELHASTLELRVIERLLKAIVEEEIEISAVIVDKAKILKAPRDPEMIYRDAVTRVLRDCIIRHPRLEVWLDKRYTTPSLRERLERTIRDGISDLARQAVVIHQEDSQKQKGLQAVDHVAWAFHQKYERANDALHKIISPRIVLEQVTNHERG